MAEARDRKAFMARNALFKWRAAELRSSAIEYCPERNQHSRISYGWADAPFSLAIPCRVAGFAKALRCRRQSPS